MSSALSFVRPVSPRGQVVVPKDIRSHLGIRREIVFEFHDGRVEIRSSGERFLKDFLDVPRRADSPSPAALKSQLGQRHAHVR